MYGEYLMTADSIAIKNPGELLEENKVEEEEKMLEAEEKELKEWENYLDKRELALFEMGLKLAEREEKAKAMIGEVEKRKLKVTERENRVREDAEKQQQHGGGGGGDAPQATATTNKASTAVAYQLELGPQPERDAAAAEDPTEKNLVPAPKTQRDKRTGGGGGGGGGLPSAVHRGPRPVWEGKQQGGGGGGGGGEATQLRKPTTHQLFVGNIPVDVDKAELTEFFERFGAVLELTIKRGRKLPNFGFVVFDDAESVQQILGQRPIKIRGNWHLNVEEMQTKSARKGVPWSQQPTAAATAHEQKPCGFASRQGSSPEQEEEDDDDEENKSAATAMSQEPSAEAGGGEHPSSKPAAAQSRAGDATATLPSSCTAAAVAASYQTWSEPGVAAAGTAEGGAANKPAPSLYSEKAAKPAAAQPRTDARPERDAGEEPAPAKRPGSPAAHEAQREQRSAGGPPPPPAVHRGPRPTWEGKQREALQVTKPTVHQLFVGKIPPDVDKAELTDFFEQFGRVLELTIKSGGQRHNFGFVLFDDSEPVQLILSRRPIKFRDNWHLNVEEMKTKSARKGVPRGSPTHTQKPTFDSRQ